MDAASLLLVLALSGGNADSRTESVEPKRHTANFAGQSGWDSNQSPPPAAPPAGDRYQLGATGGSTTVGPPPDVVDRARSAVVESGNALRDGVEAGIQAANRQLYQGNEQVIETARNAGQQLTNQFQGWAGTTAQPVQNIATGNAGALPPSTSVRQQASNPFAPVAPASSTPAMTSKARNGVAPPPWVGSVSADESDWPSVAAAPPAIMSTETPRTAAVGGAAVQRDSGWTSVHSSSAPPPLALPNLANTQDARLPLNSTPTSTAPLQPLAGSNGPNFPAAVSASQPAERSLLAPPPQSQPVQRPTAAVTAVDNWDFGWDAKTASPSAQPATIGNRYGAAAISAGTEVRGRDIAAQQPPANPLAAQPFAQFQPATGQTLDSQPTTTFGIGAFDKDSWPPSQAAPQTGATVGSSAAQPAMGSTIVTPATPNVTNAETMPGSTPAQEATAPALRASNPEQLPWLPLVVVSLALAGSIGANLFLGYSYADARHKYRTLVQKTANKFRRATAA